MKLKSREKKRTLRLVIGGVAIAVVVAFSVSFLCYKIFNAKLLSERSKNQAQLATNATKLAQYESKSLQGWVLVKDKAAGDKINASDVQMRNLPDAFTPANLITNKDDLVGKVLKINALSSTTLTWEMVYSDGPLEDSERYEEAQYIKIPTKMQKGDTVDIRVVFPTGEDYRVLVKKEITDFNSETQTVYFVDDEAESLMLMSALVDAYINNGQLYMKVYVDPQMQKTPEANYTPNKNVQLLMSQDSSVVQKAMSSLSKDLREGLDQRLDAVPSEDWIRVGESSPSGAAASGSGARATPATTSGGVNDIVNNGSSSTGSPATNSTTEPSVTSTNTDKTTIYPSTDQSDTVPKASSTTETTTEPTTSNSNDSAEAPNMLGGNQ